MKRLTIRNGDGSVSQPTDTTFEKAMYRLAEYEDTGLTPEDIKGKRVGKWKSMLVKRCDWKGKQQQYYQPITCSKCKSPNNKKDEVLPRMRSKNGARRGVTRR